MKVILVPITFSKSYNNESFQEISSVMCLKTNENIISMSTHHRLNQFNDMQLTLESLVSIHVYSNVIGMFLSNTTLFINILGSPHFSPKVLAYIALRRNFLLRLTARERFYSH